MRHEHDTNPEAWREVVCEKCGKKFMPAIYHQYVDYERNQKTRRYFCSYTCYIHREQRRKVDGRSKNPSNGTAKTAYLLQSIKTPKKRLLL